MRLHVLVLVVATVGAGCGKRLAAVETTQADHRRRLDAQEAQIASSKERARVAAAEARRQECRSASARVRAEVDRLDAACERSIAEAARCESAAQRHESHSTVVGCALGLGAAILTTGAATGLALAGCGGGYLYGEATRNVCPEVQCRSEREAWLTDAMAAADVSALPVCGAGAQLDVQRLTVGGLRITGLDAGWPAERAGLQVGDVIVMVEGELLADASTFGRVRDEHGAFSVCMVRGEHLLCVEIQAAPDVDGHLYIGIQNEWLDAVPFIGYGIVGVDENRPDELRLDDVVFGFDGYQLLAPEKLDELLDDGRDHRVHVLRDGRVAEVTIAGDAASMEDAGDDAPDVPVDADEEW